MAFSYNETPNVLGMTRNVKFNQVTWLNKHDFIEYLKQGKVIYPNIENKNFVGKSSPVSSSWYRERTQPEIIGNVLKNSTNDWTLIISYGCQTREISEDFSVLYIEDPNCFKWSRSQFGLIPKFSMCGAITEEYHFIGKTVSNLELNRLNLDHPFYYYEDDENEVVQEKYFNEPVPVLFGKVHPSHECLYVAFNNLELKTNHYEVFCMKPSPADLKTLCRSLIRNLSGRSNEKIQKIDKIPKSLVNYLQYPSYLMTGDFFFSDEKLVSRNGMFEMVIEFNGNLVIRSIIANKENLSMDELILLEDTQIKNVLCPDIQSIWLQRFNVLFERSSRHRIKLYQGISKNSCKEYQIFISNFYGKQRDHTSNQIPILEVEII